MAGVLGRTTPVDRAVYIECASPKPAVNRRWRSLNVFIGSFPVDAPYMRLVGTGLRAIVVTLDPGRRQARPESPQSMVRSLGQHVTVGGYDLAELDSLAGVADVAVVEAGEPLEIGRHAIKR